MYIIARMLSVLNQLIPKNKHIILFYDSMNPYLQDNTEAIYNYIRHTRKLNKKLFCCVPNSKVREKNIVGIYRGVLIFLRAKYVFYSFGDFRIKPSKGQMVINQWHGAPIKAIGKMMNDNIYQKEKLDNFTFLLATSPLFANVLSKAFDCNKNKIKIIGQARNDYLFSKKDGLAGIDIQKENYSKMILWMPTFRVSKDNRFHDAEIKNKETLLPILKTVNDLKSLNYFLNSVNVLLVIKIHSHAMFNRINLSNIKVITNDDIYPKGIKLYEFVKEFDALITDYSSVFIDFLLLDKPIGFTLDDYESYLENRGFSIEEPIKIMPGHHIFNYEDFSSFIKDVALSVDIYKERRKEVLKLTNSFVDAENCARLLELVGIH
ncbi:CDP-glycerol glycerophosphotransferase family protein [Weizmannia sp. CD-2023]|nr:CDP-glycerol glycerophosphotransferase family protein [Weizmannia sp. CD-2023]MEC2340578.1 CDP-glycerol glycerophosphotransferase family protein [Weizmannia sp. CD-2023]